MSTALATQAPAHSLIPPTHSHSRQLEPRISLDIGFNYSDIAPDFYAYTIKACLLPIRKVQHDLVALYFQYIHPTFPVVDERYFIYIHNRFRGHEQFIPPADFVVYQAILAAGFGVYHGSIRYTLSIVLTSLTASQ